MPTTMEGREGLLAARRHKAVSEAFRKEALLVDDSSQSFRSHKPPGESTPSALTSHNTDEASEFAKAESGKQCFKKGNKKNRHEGRVGMLACSYPSGGKGIDPKKKGVMWTSEQDGCNSGSQGAFWGPNPTRLLFMGDPLSQEGTFLDLGTSRP